MKKAVIYGAGNIGRGFIAQLFCESGYESVFIELNPAIVEQLNRERSYPIRIIREEGNFDEPVGNVRAVSGLNIESAAREISEADLMATAVGVPVLPHIACVIARGISERKKSSNQEPLNIIICENLLHAGQYLSDLVRNELPEEDRVYMDMNIGYVEASIGRMVPVMTAQMQDGNALRICTESYSTLPVDKDAFIGDIPYVSHMQPYSPFSYFMQRKLYIHNMGHAVTAYLGAQKGLKYIWQAIQDKDICALVRGAMMESAMALSIEYNIPVAELTEHADDLIERFGNRGLGDTIERVGRDLARKLAPDDRIIGAISMCRKHGIEPVCIYQGLAAALDFRDPLSRFPVEYENPDYKNHILREVCKMPEGSETWIKVFR